MSMALRFMLPKGPSVDIIQICLSWTLHEEVSLQTEKHAVFNNPSIWLCLLVWTTVVFILVAFQSGFYNPDSFKYVSIANSMLSQHHYILPMVNGQPYSDKGPIMFWLFILGWKVTGINHWWPQLLIALTAFASLLLTLKMADFLWPQESRVKSLVPILLLGLPSWIVLSNEIRIDVFLLLFCLSSFLSLLAILEGKTQYWYLYALSLALGFLCKGPVILIYTFLPALCLPFVVKATHPIKLTVWYGILMLTVLVAVVLALAWVIPAALQGGHTYYQSIFFQQVYSRAFQDYSWFYYIERLPMFILPWGLYMPFLLGAIKYSKFQTAERFCWLIIVISLIVFSLYGQKRVHYLNPDFPLFALLMARAISNYMSVVKLPKLQHQWFFSGILFFSAVVILALPHFSIHFNPAIQAQLFYILKYNIFISIMLLFVACVYSSYCPKTIPQQMLMIMLPSAAVSTAFLVLRVVG